jgi:mannose-6-phosphate isomerase-like protein (cupin superfamily)
MNNMINMYNMNNMNSFYNPYGLNNAYLPPHYANVPAYGANNTYGAYDMQYCQYPYPCSQCQHIMQTITPAASPANTAGYESRPVVLRDYGPAPFVIDIDDAAEQNNNFRYALWTGKYLQLTLMSIRPGEDIGLEVHPELDQFLRIEDGQGVVMMGDSKDRLDFRQIVREDYAVVIPAGKWHNLINTGYKPIKLYSIYAPPQHPHGTVHRTKADAEAAEHHH